jgi:mannose-1-phosphate guanylyltransferase
LRTFADYLRKYTLNMGRINNHLVIMAGGVGSRFWPMSTAECPKQFIDVLGTGKTLLQLTVERFGSLVAPELLLRQYVVEGVDGV